MVNSSRNTPDITKNIIQIYQVIIAKPTYHSHILMTIKL